MPMPATEAFLRFTLPCPAYIIARTYLYLSQPHCPPFGPAEGFSKNSLFLAAYCRADER